MAAARKSASAGVAAGVGIAPFRSFWLERAARAKILGNLAPAVLFFGCRSKSSDCLFQEARSHRYFSVNWCLPAL